MSGSRRRNRAGAGATRARPRRGPRQNPQSHVRCSRRFPLSIRLSPLSPLSPLLSVVGTLCTVLYCSVVLLCSALLCPALPCCTPVSLAFVPTTQISFSSSPPLLLSTSPPLLHHQTSFHPSSLPLSLFTKPPLHSFSGHSFLSSVIVVVIVTVTKSHDPKNPKQSRERTYLVTTADPPT